MSRNFFFFAYWIFKILTSLKSNKWIKKQKKPLSSVMSILTLSSWMWWQKFVREMRKHFRLQDIVDPITFININNYNITWDRNGSTSGSTPWQIYNDDDMKIILQ
jgi:hypothetical protein